mmetsp:Transcript_14096/g.34258  ORF Transcript_14096/g.34258 Transcript_14096/m.34258 type:complete len:207 (+) Transcript_14096:272-892(+)
MYGMDGLKLYAVAANPPPFPCKLPRRPPRLWARAPMHQGWRSASRAVGRSDGLAASRASSKLRKEASEHLRLANTCCRCSGELKVCSRPWSTPKSMDCSEQPTAKTSEAKVGGSVACSGAGCVPHSGTGSSYATWAKPKSIRTAPRSDSVCHSRLPQCTSPCTIPRSDKKTNDCSNSLTTFRATSSSTTGPSRIRNGAPQRVIKAT